MIPITNKKKELTKKLKSINRKNVCVEKGGMFGMFGMCIQRKRTISKIQRDKNQIIFPRDGFECDGGDVGVVEICRVVHYDVLIIEFCVKKRRKKKEKKKKYKRD